MPIAVNIGLTEAERERVAEAMSVLLADSYTLYLKTHNYHWNVTGPHFAALHTMFETQYQELWLAADEIAERIRSVGFPSPGSYRQFGELTAIAEAEGVPAAMAMVEHLAHDNEQVARSAGAAFDVADEVGDQATADLAVQRQQVHEKNAWMLRSMLE
jgi:starvation-inducible DNA-binding protein